MSKNITTKSKNATKIRKNATKTTKKCGQCPKNAFNASILFQKSSECKKCFFNAGTIARCLVVTVDSLFVVDSGLGFVVDVHSFPGFGIDFKFLIPKIRKKSASV